MLHAPMSLEKMTYDAGTGTVIYRSKMQAGLKRNFQVIRRILEHLELWALLSTERSPPVDPVSCPPYVSLPLTYHPFPTSPDLPHKKTPRGRRGAGKGLLRFGA
jgi:hypothetical protein